MKKILGLIFYLFAIVSAGFAQTTPQTFIRQNVDKQIKETIEKSSALTGFFAIDLTSGETFGFNENMIFPQASAIKIPILMEVYKQAHEGKFALTDLKTVETSGFVGGSGIIQAMADPVSLSIRNLCILMMTLSDNTATNVLIDLVGMKNINATQASLGQKNTKVQRRMIDAAASGRGDENISTPSEAAKILQILYKGEFVNKVVSEEIISILKKGLRPGSRIATPIPEKVEIAYKPGGLSGVSTEWTLVYLTERPYAVAFMETYKIAGESDHVMESVSEILYNYFWRLGNGTRYGVYTDPSLIK
jgi:beta-lactamase class A